MTDQLNENGRCCGRKPLEYKRDGYLFCFRCDRKYDADSKHQVANFAWGLSLETGYFVRVDSRGNPIADAEGDR